MTIRPQISSRIAHTTIGHVEFEPVEASEFPPVAPAEPTRIVVDVVLPAPLPTAVVVGHAMVVVVVLLAPVVEVVEVVLEVDDVLVLLVLDVDVVAQGLVVVVVEPARVVDVVELVPPVGATVVVVVVPPVGAWVVVVVVVVVDVGCVAPVVKVKLFGPAPASAVIVICDDQKRSVCTTKPASGRVHAMPMSYSPGVRDANNAVLANDWLMMGGTRPSPRPGVLFRVRNPVGSARLLVNAGSPCGVPEPEYTKSAGSLVAGVMNVW